MCGIAGIVGGGFTREDRRLRLEAMVATLRYRGPDDTGYWVGDGAAIGMARLSIIDIAGGHQPMTNEDGSIHVVQNGEIYNYRERTSELVGHGHTFRSRSDTEVLVHGFEQWRAELPVKLRGMYAFAAWDESSRELLLAIDRLGIKPLYYFAFEGGFIFGSELKTIMASGLIPRVVDPQALSFYLTYGYVPPPFAIFKGVKKLAPAERLRWHAGSIQRDLYWQVPSPDDRPIDEANLKAALLERLEDAVRSHLVSDVPVGAFLSGGMDSSSVVALAAGMNVTPLKTFTIGFPSRAYDERELARLVAKRYQTDHHELVVEPESVEVLPRLIEYLDEPFADSSAVPTYFVSKLAREHVKVALSGDGGDEIFLGYRYFLSTRIAQRLAWIPRPARRLAAAAVGSFPRLPGAQLARRSELLRKRIDDCLYEPLEVYDRKLRDLPSELGAQVFKPGVWDSIQQERPWDHLRDLVQDAANRTTDPLAPFGFAALKFSLAGDMLVKVDRMSMLNSLEVRVPFLDHELVEFMTRLPTRIRFSARQQKQLLRDTMQTRLPGEIVGAPKTGFSMPISDWFKDDVVGFVHDCLRSGASADGPFRATAIEKLFTDLAQGRTTLSGAIWTLLVFELWRRREGVSF